MRNWILGILLLSGLCALPILSAAPLSPRAAYTPLDQNGENAPQADETLSDGTAAGRFSADNLSSHPELQRLLKQAETGSLKGQVPTEVRQLLNQDTAVSAPESGEKDSSPTEAPTSSAKPPRDEVFSSVLQKMLPMSPEQIRQFHRFYDMTQRAAAENPTTPPTPVSSSLSVSLEPGQHPPLVRLGAGFVSSLIFLDATGAPWPIVSYSIGDPSRFNVQWDQSSHALFIQSVSPYVHGNLAVRLQDLDTPVMLSLVSGQREIDYRVDIQIKGRGPQARVPVVTSQQSTATQTALLRILDGLAPAASRQLTLSTPLGEAWLVGSTLYLRTSAHLISPAWRATVASADGMRVYELAPTPSLLLSSEGQTIAVRLGGL